MVGQFFFIPISSILAEAPSAFFVWIFPSHLLPISKNEELAGKDVPRNPTVLPQGSPGGDDVLYGRGG
jgi:hypothetical protein